MDANKLGSIRVAWRPFVVAFLVFFIEEARHAPTLLATTNGQLSW
jgi:hypothetical protein